MLLAALSVIEPAVTEIGPGLAAVPASVEIPLPVSFTLNSNFLSALPFVRVGVLKFASSIISG